MQEISTHKLIELFCGQGAFSFFAKDVVKEALGIELNSEAVIAAQEDALKMGATHLKFKMANLTGESESMEAEILAFGADTLLVNPPRRGLGQSIELLKKIQIPYLLYSSCAHETLADDLQQLPQYQVEKVQIFDLFPHTAHFETLVLLKRAEIE